MTKIHQLSEATANKIAAGEVVERPSSVIKELCENSIDAHATHITIEVFQGGSEKMIVTDDGDGMSHDDALMCFQRHATSKITDDSDLFNIMTLGFRGEAMPSIAAVSVMTLETSDGEEGSEIVCRFGKRDKAQYIDCAKGTKITVARIFQNVPARLKYMKSVNAEFAAIYTLIEHLALSHPDIAFTLFHDDREIFRTNGHGNLLEVIASIYGMKVARRMIEVSFGTEEFMVRGYVSKIDTTRASKSHIVTLVNGRYVRHMRTINTINEVYRPYLADKRYPIAVLNIIVDPYLVDVNVHPAKLEVRFSKENVLNDIITEGLKDALTGTDLTYQTGYQGKGAPAFTPSALHEASDAPAPAFVREDAPVWNAPKKDAYEDGPTLFEVNEEQKKREEAFRQEGSATFQTDDHVTKDKYTRDDHAQSAAAPVLKPIKEKIYARGQVRGTYLFGENDKGMYLIDQHAAQERINYEYFRDKYARLDLTMQDLIVPVTLEYTESEMMTLAEHQDVLDNVGIHLERMGPTTCAVRALPVWMRDIDPQIFIDEMIQTILAGDVPDVVKMQDHAIATLACKASLKANTYLNLSDIQTILDNLMRCDNPYVCPHGRPTLIFYSDYDLEKLFQRVVNE